MAKLLGKLPHHGQESMGSHVDVPQASVIEPGPTPETTYGRDYVNPDTSTFKNEVVGLGGQGVPVENSGYTDLGQGHFHAHPPGHETITSEKGETMDAFKQRVGGIVSSDYAEAHPAQPSPSGPPSAAFLKGQQGYMAAYGSGVNTDNMAKPTEPEEK